MNIVRLDRDNVHLLRQFIAAMGSSAAGFRYFSSRSIEACAQHLVTLLGLGDDGTPVCYGHLDADQGTVWLGLCVTEGHTGRGLGKRMLRALLAEGDRSGVGEIALSVDAGNLRAIRLYERSGFTRSRLNGTTAFYTRRRAGA